jgi:hypothetical protein
MSGRKCWSEKSIMLVRETPWIDLDAPKKDAAGQLVSWNSPPDKVDIFCILLLLAIFLAQCHLLAA